MSQPDLDLDRYKPRGRKERTPAQLAVLAQAREKAKIVIAERAKINALQENGPISLNPCRKRFLLPPNPNLNLKSAPSSFELALLLNMCLSPKTKMKNLV